MRLVLLCSQSDARLVALARQGHELAFEAIVRRYRRPLLSACRRLVPGGLAEEVLQQALVAAWTDLRRGGDVCDLRVWLFRIARPMAVQRSGHVLVDTLGAAEEDERGAVAHETVATIARLPPRQREALLRIAVHGEDALAAPRFHRSRVVASALVPMPVAARLARER